MWFLALLLGAPASATWSIVAADPATGQVGGAGTSCVGGLDVAIIYASEPGVGAVHAQARVNQAGRDEAARLLAAGSSPEEIIQSITDPSFDGRAGERQYGVVDTQGGSAGWTGSDTLDWAGDVQGSADGIVYSAQGNILTGEPVVGRTAAAFEAGGQCDLPERLLVALTAGRADGEGDSRCTDRGVPSDSAFLRVQATDGTLVDLTVTGTGNDDPLDALRTRFDEWRADNPCPEVDTDVAIEDSDADTDGASVGCGCSGLPASGLAPSLVLGVLGLARRRRSTRPSRPDLV